MKLIGPDAQRSDHQLKCYKILVYRFNKTITNNISLPDMWNLGPNNYKMSLTSHSDVTSTSQTSRSHVKAVKAVNNKHIVRNMQAITTFFVKNENFKKTTIFMYTILGFDKLSHRCVDTEQYMKQIQHSSIT